MSLENYMYVIFQWKLYLYFSLIFLFFVYLHNVLIFGVYYVFSIMRENGKFAFNIV